MKRVLLDANVFISYLLRRETGSPITRIVEAGIAGAFTILLPEALLEEFTARIGQKPYLVERIRPVEMSQFYTLLLAQGEVIPEIDGPIPAVTRDPKDDYLLAYAVVGNADFLVTGDEDLLVLGEVQGVRVLRPREFVERLLTPQNPR